MTGFGNENNNENQNFDALNMGQESMFSSAPQEAQTPDMDMFSVSAQNMSEEKLGNAPQRREQTPPSPQAPQQPQQPSQTPQSAFQQRAPQVPPRQQAPQAPQAKAEPKEELDDEVITVKPIRFASFENEVSAVGTPRKNLDIMQDVKAKITVELGRCKMKVKKVLDIQKGSIIEINKVAGEQVELFVCGKLVAHGEVIVIEDKFGLRITSIIEDKSL